MTLRGFEAPDEMPKNPSASTIQSTSAAQNPAQLDPKSGKSGAESGAASSRKEHAGRIENPVKQGENCVSAVFYGVSGMEDNGLEPMTYALPARRSPN